MDTHAPQPRSRATASQGTHAYHRQPSRPVSPAAELLRLRQGQKSIPDTSSLSMRCPVSEGCAAVQRPSVTLHGSFCAQVKARRIVALDGERASASGGAFQILRLKDKVMDAPADVRGMRSREGADRDAERLICAQVAGTVDHRAGRRPGQRSRQCLSRIELQLIRVRIMCGEDGAAGRCDRTVRQGPSCYVRTVLPAPAGLVEASPQRWVVDVLLQRLQQPRQAASPPPCPCLFGSFAENSPASQNLP